MPENMMFADLLAAQKEMPALQRTGINPHFRNKFVPLEELIDKVVPVLNKHSIVLIQQPVTLDGQPALRTALLHVSGELIGSTMLLMASQEGPQGQGSAITYARRYSLMSVLGLSADADDDAEGAKTHPPAQHPAERQVQPSRPPQRPPARNGGPSATEAQSRAIHVLMGKVDADTIAAITSAHAPAEAFDEDGKFHTSRLTVGQASTLIDELKKAQRLAGV